MAIGTIAERNTIKNRRRNKRGAVVFKGKERRKFLYLLKESRDQIKVGGGCFRIKKEWGSLPKPQSNLYRELKWVVRKNHAADLGFDYINNRVEVMLID